MKTLYEVRINTVDAEYGRPNGFRHVIYTTDRAIANAVAADKTEQVAAIEMWWIGVAKNAKGAPDVVVVELGELWE